MKDEMLLSAAPDDAMDDPQIIAPTNPGGIIPSEQPGGEPEEPVPAPEEPEEPVPTAPEEPDGEPEEPQTPGDEQQPPAETEPPADDEQQTGDDEDGEPGVEQLFENVQKPAPAEAGFPWLGVGIGAGVAVLVALCAVGALLHRRKKRRGSGPVPKTVNLGGPAAPPSAPAVCVGKLHEQGARASQQDCFSVSPDELLPTHGLLAVVADGMGGLADGDKVSQTAVTAFMNGFYTVQGEPQQTLLALLEQANQAVNDLLGPSGLRKSGSTLVAGLIRDEKFYYVSVGDSRICLYRDGALRQLNREHIYRNELNLRAVNGEESFLTAAQDPTGGGLTSFLGMGRLAHIDVPAQPEAIRPGDKFILMSDGVYNALPAEELAHALALDAPQAAQAIRAAVQAKGYANQDNYTAVILSCGETA